MDNPESVTKITLNLFSRKCLTRGVLLTIKTLFLNCPHRDLSHINMLQQKFMKTRTVKQKFAMAVVKTPNVLVSGRLKK